MAKAKFERTKPHVNVGTIGHVDHGKTTLTAAITEIQAEKGLAQYIGVRPDRQGAGGARSGGITIATAHVEYETDEAALRARGLPGARRLREEHDHGRGADGRGDPGGVGGGRPDAADAGAHPAGAQVNVPYIVVFLNKWTWWTTRSCWSWWSWRCGSCCRSYNFPGDDTPIIRGSALKALESGDPNSEQGQKIQELMDALDSYIPQPEREIDKPFLMPVEDVFSITGRGTVATGRIERGMVKVQEEVALVGFNSAKKTVVTGVEMFRKLLDEGQAGDNVGLLLRGVEKTEIERGMVLAKPGTITPHTKFKAEVYVLTKEEGGRHTPFFKGYRPQFYFRTTDVTGSVELPEGVEMVMPGDNMQMTIELITPIAMDEGLRFAIREGGRTVGAGVVTKIIK